VPPEVVGELMEAQRQANQAIAKRITAIFNKTLTGSGVSFEWRTIEAHLETAASIVMRLGRSADLVVLGQSDKTINLIDGIATTEEVMLGIGRPVLVVPGGAAVTTLGKRVLVAWNGGRESARAAFDALPFMERAEDVRIFTAGRAAGKLWGSLAENTAPTADLEEALVRHGIRCKVLNVTASGSEVADKLMAEAKAQGSDLIVMGGYGHWRVREIVFGGATRGVLEHASVPVFMSH
jgi:nucleotide-binding universal stress UspA family protein